MPLHHTILNAPRRAPVAGLALLQGVAFVIMTVTSAALIGKICGAVSRAGMKAKSTMTLTEASGLSTKDKSAWMPRMATSTPTMTAGMLKIG